jgi:hypothetical protein
MQVGYHQIEGKKVPLKKPLAILEKHPHAASPPAPPGGSGGCGGASASGRGEDRDVEMAEGATEGASPGAGGCQYEVRRRHPPLLRPGHRGVQAPRADGVRPPPPAWNAPPRCARA